MRASDQVLYDDLMNANLPRLAARAAAGEWNDYFGIHDFPQVELIDTLRKESNLSDGHRMMLVEHAINGKYDGTQAECDEWAHSESGAETFHQLRTGSWPT